MDVTPLIPEGKKIITGYGDGGFSISREIIPGNIIILPDQVIRWEVASAQEINIDSLAHVITSKDKIEILLIGTGASHSQLDMRLKQELKQHGISMDIMSTGAACRTYNILLSEERRVAAALIAV